MTRDEAIKIMEVQQTDAGEPYRRLENEIWIQRFVALGMLKLDEPKSAVENFEQVLASLGCPPSLRDGIRSAMDRNDLKIVSK